MQLALANTDPPIYTAFTAREIEVLEWTAKGKTRMEISIILCISEQTVKCHLENARRKLEAVNKTQAIALAMASGLIKPYENRTAPASRAAE